MSSPSSSAELFLALSLNRWGCKQREERPSPLSAYSPNDSNPFGSRRRFRVPPLLLLSFWRGVGMRKTAFFSFSLLDTYTMLMPPPPLTLLALDARSTLCLFTLDIGREYTCSCSFFLNRMVPPPPPSPALTPPLPPPPPVAVAGRLGLLWLMLVPLLLRLLLPRLRKPLPLLPLLPEEEEEEEEDLPWLVQGRCGAGRFASAFGMRGDALYSPATPLVSALPVFSCSAAPWAAST